ncbi:MAG: cell wall hydrolase, partial [Oscillospiraceae bacterium]|nr:cell wall hydrolase [Oscillospiraceae bacterium]
MCKKISLLTIICLLCSLFSGYAVMELDSSDPAGLSGKTSVSVDGATEFTGYCINGTMYVPLRSFCGALNLGAAVSWDDAADTMSVTMTHQNAQQTVTARVGEFYLYVNDRVVYLGADILSRSGNVLVPLSGLCGAFGIRADDADGLLHLYTDGMQICARGSAVYNANDLRWLSHIINAEAGNQSMEGQICVGNVVLNRVADERFPDTVEAVVFSPNQFCPVKSGTIWCTPDADAVAAAKLCLEGVNLAGQSTYFVNPT